MTVQTSMSDSHTARLLTVTCDTTVSLHDVTDKRTGFHTLCILCNKLHASYHCSLYYSQPFRVLLVALRPKPLLVRCAPLNWCSPKKLTEMYEQLVMLVVNILD